MDSLLCIRSPHSFRESPRKGARKLVPCAKIVEKCRKLFLTLFDDFCSARKLPKSVENSSSHFLTFFFAMRKKCQKVSAQLLGHPRVVFPANIPGHLTKRFVSEIANWGVLGGGFSAMVGVLASLCEKICYCKGTLAKIDTSLAIAMSGLRQIYYCSNPPLPKTPHSIFPIVFLGFPGTYRTFCPQPLHVEDPHPYGRYLTNPGTTPTTI